MTMTLLLWLHQTNDYDVTSLVTSNQWIWRYLLLLWLHQTNDYNGICCFTCYIKPMTMMWLLWLHLTNNYVWCNQRSNKYCHSHWFDVTKEVTNTVIVVASLVTSNQWLCRCFSGYIKPMTMMVFVASLVTSNLWLWQYLLLLWLHQTNEYDGIFFLLWLHETYHYDGICCFSGYIKPVIGLI
jgi:hypothetical protein